MEQEYDCIFRALLPRIPNITIDDIKNSFSDWEFIRLTRGNNLVGVALRHASELHLIIDPIYQNSICFVKQCAKIVSETVNKYGYAETKVLESHEVGHRLAKLLGFNITSIDAGVVQYKKEV